jgi:hypothetical protein
LTIGDTVILSELIQEHKENKVVEFVDVVDHNPIGFVNTVCEKLSEGYAVRNTNEGVPFFGAYHHQVRLFKEARGGLVEIPADTNGRVEHYEAMAFLKLLESFVEAGYEFDLHGAHFFDERSFKSIQMRQKVYVEDTKPAKKAPAKKALKAEQTIEEIGGE